MEQLFNAILIAALPMFISYMVKAHLILDTKKDPVTLIWLVTGLGTVLFSFGLLLLFGFDSVVLGVLTLFGGTFGFLIDGLATSTKKRLEEGRFKAMGKQMEDNLNER